MHMKNEQVHDLDSKIKKIGKIACVNMYSKTKGRHGKT